MRNVASHDILYLWLYNRLVDRELSKNFLVDPSQRQVGHPCCKPSDSPSGSKSAAHNYRGCGCILSVCVSCNKSYYLLFLLCFFENSSDWASQQSNGLLVFVPCDSFLINRCFQKVLVENYFPTILSMKTNIQNFSTGRLCRSISGIVQKTSWSIEKASIFSLKTRNISLYVHQFRRNH